MSVPTNNSPVSRTRVLVALGVGLAAFAAYVFAATPSAYPLDSAELAAASFGLGVAHPPGEETALLWGKLFTLLPTGGGAFKVALSQAAAGAIAAVLVFLLLLALMDRVPTVVAGLSEHMRVTLAVATALVFAFAPGVVVVSDRAEVYALQTALSLAALWLALRANSRQDARLALLAALLIGLGIGNHSLVAGLTGMGAVVAALPVLLAEQRRGRFIALSFAAFAMGLLVHGYLPLRTAALHATGTMDDVLWGDARSLRGLWWVVSARTFAEKAAIVHGNASPADLPFLLVEELGLVLALAGPAGAYFLLRLQPSRMAGLAVLVTALGSLAAALVGGVDPGNPDIRGYLGVAIACVAVLAGGAVTIGLAVFRLQRLRRFLVAFFVVAAAARFPSPTQYPGLAEARATETEVRQLLDELPPRAALFTNHFETGFLVGYLRQVEGARPDVAWAHLAFANGPGFSERVRHAEPELAAVIDAYRGGRLLGALGVLDHERPVRIEPDGVLGADVRRGLGPAGDLWSLATRMSPEEAPPRASWMLAEAEHDRQVRGYLAWRDYIDARWSCDLGLDERARARFAELEKLVPKDERFRELQKHCR